jgi:alpha-mannosidase
MMPTPGAQELGPHRFTWALYLHPGDWQRGGVAAEARRFAAPAWPVVTRGRTQVPAGRAMVELEPGPLLLSALHPDEDHGLIVRLVNFSAERSEGRLRPVAPIASVEAIDPLGQPSSRVRVSHEGEIVRVALDAWQIATFRLRWKGA